MKYKLFVETAKKFNDFTIQFTQRGGAIVATLDQTTPYVARRTKRLKLGLEHPDGYINVWSWTHNSVRRIYLDRVKRVTSLAAVLQNTDEC